MRLNAVARSFLALYDSESNAASLREKNVVLYPFVFTQGSFFFLWDDTLGMESSPES